jgi:hypothetical protein
MSNSVRKNMQRVPAGAKRRVSSSHGRKRTLAALDASEGKASGGPNRSTGEESFCAAHGGQQLAFWNAHHDERGFAPMHISCGERHPVNGCQNPRKDGAA